MNKENRAIELFSNGFNCAQAVLGAFCDDLGLDRNTAMKVASGLGGGVKTGEICGAVSGAVLAIGQKYGYGTVMNPEAKEKTNKLVQSFHEEFRKTQSSIICREILGLDPSIPDQREDILKKDLFNSTCPLAIKTSVRILSQMID